MLYSLSASGQERSSARFLKVLGVECYFLEAEFVFSCSAENGANFCKIGYSSLMARSQLAGALLGNNKIAEAVKMAQFLVEASKYG